MNVDKVIMELKGNLFKAVQESQLPLSIVSLVMYELKSEIDKQITMNLPIIQGESKEEVKE